MINHKDFKLRFFLLLVLSSSLLLSGCDLFDDDDDPPPANIQTFNLSLTGQQESPPVTTNASGEGVLTVNLDTGEVSGSLTTTGMTASAAHIHEGFGGTVGPIIITLQQDTVNTSIWRLPTGALLSDTQLVSLQDGGLYVNVHSVTFPAGEIRAQIVTEDIELIQLTLSARQQVPPLTPVSTGVAVATLNTVTDELTLHVRSWGLANGVAAHIHRAKAGYNGDIVLDLQQDDADEEHWFLDTLILDSNQRSQLDGAEFYINVHSQANPSGELRGQIIRAPYELILVELDGDQEVPPVVTDATGVGALTLNTSTKALELAINTLNLSDAVASHIHRGFSGVSGGVEIPLSQDTTDVSRWELAPTTLTDAQYDRLRASGFYLNVHSPAEPGGEIRGQIVPLVVTPLPAFTVSAMDPAPDTTVGILPDSITVTFNADVFASSLTTTNFQLQRAGGDDSFDDGNEVPLTVTAVDPIAGNARGATVDISANSSVDDLYQFTAVGTGAAPLIADSGAVLDGDQDGSEGGDFIRTFTVATAPPSGLQATLSSIQTEIFTPICSSCHGAGVANAGMRVDDGSAFSNLVSVASSEVPSLFRVEPGDPDNSYLIQKLEGSAAIGVRMPLGGPFLSQDDINVIRQWITAGALNN